MRRATATALAGVLVLTSAGAAFAARPGLERGTYKIDPTHTYAHFAINHMGLSTVRRRLDVDRGRIQIANDPSNSRISVALDASSVDTGDAARDEHPRNMDGFFNVRKYPSIEFESTAIRFDDDDEATVDGKLTRHGVTRPVTLDVDDIACRANPLEKSRYTCGFTAETDIRRSAFGMDAFSRLVGDEVELSIEVEASKPASAAS